MRSTYDALSMEFSYMQFYLVDVDEGDLLAQNYEIEHMPTFVVFSMLNLKFGWGRVRN